MERSIEIFTLLTVGAVSVSHICQPRAWKAYFDLLRRQGHAGILFNGLMTVSFGALIVSFHDVWTGAPIIVTLIGWGQVAKGLLHLCIPALGMRSMALIDRKTELRFAAAGVLMLLILTPVGLHVLGF